MDSQQRILLAQYMISQWPKYKSQANHFLQKKPSIFLSTILRVNKIVMRSFPAKRMFKSYTHNMDGVGKQDRNLEEGLYQSIIFSFFFFYWYSIRPSMYTLFYVIGLGMITFLVKCSISLPSNIRELFTLLKLCRHDQKLNSNIIHITADYYI